MPTWTHLSVCVVVVCWNCNWLRETYHLAWIVIKLTARQKRADALLEIFEREDKHLHIKHTHTATHARL